MSEIKKHWRSKIGGPNAAYVGITKAEIERAMMYTSSNKAASFYLGVSYKTYKKYASRYLDEDGVSLFDKHKNKEGYGIKKKNPKLRSIKGKSVIEILENKASRAFFSMKQLKPRLIQEGILKEECCRCKFSEKRLLDQRAPLLLNFVDGDKQNWSLQNLELLCYNCYYINIGDIYTRKQIEAMEDWKSKVTKTTKVDMEIPNNIDKEFEELTGLNNEKVTRDYIEQVREEDFAADLISYIKPGAK